MFRVSMLMVCFALFAVACEKKSEPVKPPAAPVEKQPEVTQAMKDAYPLELCVVTDEKLGGHGDPFDIVHKGQLVRFCCESCVDDFNKDPEKYLAKIADAAKAKAPAPEKK